MEYRLRYFGRSLVHLGNVGLLRLPFGGYNNADVLCVDVLAKGGGTDATVAAARFREDAVHLLGAAGRGSATRLLLLLLLLLRAAAPIVVRADKAVHLKQYWGFVT
jgi:hypothetical protein